MLEKNTQNERPSTRFGTRIESSNNERILDEVIEYVLENHNNSTKIIEALSIVHDNKNIIMILLEMRNLNAIKKLFTVGATIFSHATLLTHTDKQGKNVLCYFIEFASSEILEEFIELMLAHCPPEDMKTLLRHKENDGKTPLMILCGNKKNDTAVIFKTIIDCIASVCGISTMHKELTKVDANGDNILMLSIKSGNYSIGVAILDLISKTVTDLVECQKIQNLIVTNCDAEQNSPLMLLAKNQPCSESKTLQEKLLEIIQNDLDNSSLVFDSNADGNNVLMLSMISHNDHMSDCVMRVINEMQLHTKTVVLNKICEQNNSENDNFITLAFKNDQSTIYLSLIEKMEEFLQPEKIIEVFRKTISSYHEFLHVVLTAKDANAMVNVMKYIKQLKTLSNDEREDMSNLIMRKDSMNRTLLVYAIENSNLEVCNLVLDIAKEFCTPLTLKLILTSRDINGQTAYILSKLKNNKNLAKCIEAFAESTDNYNYLESQLKELNLIQKQQSSKLLPLVTRIFH